MASKYEKFVIVTDHDVHLILQCIFCGQKWSPNQVPGGRLHRGAYMCPNDCTDDYDVAYEQWEKMLFKKNPFAGKFEPIPMRGGGKHGAV